MSDSLSLEDWACIQLDSLGLPDGLVIIQYLKHLEDSKEVENYLQSILDVKNDKHKKFIKEFVNKQAEITIDKRFYRKEDFSDEKLDKKKSKTFNNNRSTNATNKNEFQQRLDNCKKNYPINDNFNEKSDDNLSTNNSPKGNKQNGKKKTKFVNLYADGELSDVVLLKGRHSCECLASKHKLVNNCLSCGRIVCEQEGAGPCLYCGVFVQTKQDRAAGVNIPESVDKIHTKHLSNVNDPVHMQKAIEHKNKLLEFERTSEKRTKIFDDESDYFSSTSRWIGKADREILQAKEHEFTAKKYDRSNQKMTIDILGRKIVVDNSSAGVYPLDDPVVKSILEPERDDIFAACERGSVPPPIHLHRPVYVEPSNANTKLAVSAGQNLKLCRIQDRELQEMTDQAMCLSMHQPWASLLVMGIKLHEGRTWYSPHRGRLWIASAAKIPHADDIETAQEFYRQHHAAAGLKKPNFPAHYPSGCLLGCVDILEVLPQEEYRVKYPDGESDSPFVFICANALEMIFKFPMKGAHKIFSLDSKLHQAARKALK